LGRLSGISNEFQRNTIFENQHDNILLFLSSHTKYSLKNRAK